MTRVRTSTSTALVALITLLSSCGLATEAEESGWWTERTWAGEIGVCIDAIGDPGGCQWLAGILIHRRCSLKVYQTLAAGMFVGGDFETMYSEAEMSGDCEGPEETSDYAYTQNIIAVRNFNLPSPPGRSHRAVVRGKRPLPGPPHVAGRVERQERHAHAQIALFPNTTTSEVRWGSSTSPARCSANPPSTHP